MVHAPVAPSLRGSLAAAVVAAIACISPGAQAQGFPDHAVRIVVPSAPGGSIDTTARTVAMKLAEVWSQPVYIENRPGASMIIGAETVARAANDGYTLLVAHDGAMAINPAIYPTLSYNTQRDFVSVSLLSTIPLMILAGPSLQAKTFKEMLALARARPGTLNHASGGNGTLLPSELFKAMAKIDYMEVPYKGGAPAIRATMAGETNITIADMSTAAGALKGGQLRPLAVTTLARSQEYPDIPTVHESGVPNYDAKTWMGLFAPAGTPKAVTDKISADVQKVLAMPDTRKRLEASNMEVQSGKGEDLARLVQADTDKWRALVKERNLRLE